MPINSIIEALKSTNEEELLDALLLAEEIMNVDSSSNAQKKILIDTLILFLERCPVNLLATSFWVLGKAYEDRVFGAMRPFLVREETLLDENLVWQFLNAYENFCTPNRRILPEDILFFTRVTAIHRLHYKHHEKFTELLARFGMK